MKLNIGSRLLISAALVVVATFALFIVYFDINERSAIKTRLEANITETSQLASESIANWMAARKLLMEGVAHTIALNDNATSVKARQIVSRKVLEDTFMYAYLGTAAGEMTMHPNDPLPADYDPRTRPWYKDARNADTSILTEPYVDATTGKLIVTMATPVNKDGKTIGVVGGDLEITAVAKMIKNIDFSDFGYAYLVNEKGIVLIHPNKNFTLKPLAEVFPEHTPNISQGIKDFTDVSGNKMYAFVPIKGLPSVHWKLGIVIDRGKAFASLYDFRYTSVAAGLFAVLAILGLMGLMIRIGVSRPIIGMTAVMTKLSEGNHNVEVPEAKYDDEIGAMRAAMEVFKNNAIEMERMREEQIAAEHRAEEEKKAALMHTADEFENSVGTIVGLVSSAATELNSSAEAMSHTAENSAQQSTAASGASDEASRNVATVASAAEQLSSSISEIGGQVEKAAAVASQALSEAEAANAKVQGLASAAEKIGEVVNLITDIANQTNLLALNATIEAARAGDAGKGFAVVASEVKNLANQTARATEEIAQQITAVQEFTKQSVDAIGNITTVIRELDEIATSIASAVEEQTVATQEITRGVAMASSGTQEVSENLVGVKTAAQETGDAATEIRAASSDLSLQSETLQTEVANFLNRIRNS